MLLSLRSDDFGTIFPSTQGLKESTDTNTLVLDSASIGVAVPDKHKQRAMRQEK